MDFSIIIQLAILIAILKIAYDIHRVTGALGTVKKPQTDHKSVMNKMENSTSPELVAGDPGTLNPPIPPKGGPHYVQVVVVDQDFT